MLQLLQKKRLHLDELGLTFANEHSTLMNDVFKLLNAMYEKGVFKKLYLKFERKSLITDNLNLIATANGLVGIICAYKIDDKNYNHMIDLTKHCNNIKYLAIHWMFADSTVIAQQLREVDEMEITETSAEAILSFAQHAPKLEHFRIKHIQGNRMLDVNMLNKQRCELNRIERDNGSAVGAAKLNIYIPEKMYIKMKWSSNLMKCEFVEIKREESYIDKKNRLVA